MCIYACQLKVDFRQPCRECLAEWAEAMWADREFHRLRNIHRQLLNIPEATDAERRAFLDERAPVVTD